MAVFAFAIIRTFRLEIDPGRFARAVLPVFAVFVLWDVLAVSLGHWEFGLDKMLGIVVFNQPLEELAFFVIAPFMYVVIWEACKKFVK
jgi:lycopene cyclase domain-containing protein